MTEAVDSQEPTEQRPPILEPRLPKFQWGQRVTPTGDLINDGSYPNEATNALLARAGELGEIVQIGRHEETNTPVYLVEFPSGRVIGCLEEEITLLAV